MQLRFKTCMSTVVAATATVMALSAPTASAAPEDVTVVGALSGTTVSATIENSTDEDLICELLISLSDGEPLMIGQNLLINSGHEVPANSRVPVAAAFTDVSPGTWSFQSLCLLVDSIETDTPFLPEYWSSYSDPRIAPIFSGPFSDIELPPPNQTAQALTVVASQPEGLSGKGWI